MRKFKLLINGKLVSGGARLDVINPATEEVLVEAPRADRAQLNEAIAAAKAAFPAWGTSGKGMRAKILESSPCVQGGVAPGPEIGRQYPINRPRSLVKIFSAAS
jgi:hypothetical protein